MGLPSRFATSQGRAGGGQTLPAAAVRLRRPLGDRPSESAPDGPAHRAQAGAQRQPHRPGTFRVPSFSAGSGRARGREGASAIRRNKAQYGSIRRQRQESLSAPRLCYCIPWPLLIAADCPSYCGPLPLLIAARCFSLLRPTAETARTFRGTAAAVTLKNAAIGGAIARCMRNNKWGPIFI